MRGNGKKRKPFKKFQTGSTPRKTTRGNVQAELPAHLKEPPNTVRGVKGRDILPEIECTPDEFACLTCSITGISYGAALQCDVFALPEVCVLYGQRRLFTVLVRTSMYDTSPFPSTSHRFSSFFEHLRNS